MAGTGQEGGVHPRTSTELQPALALIRILDKSNTPHGQAQLLGELEESGLVLQGSDSLEKLDTHPAFLKGILPKHAALNPHSGL